MNLYECKDCGKLHHDSRTEEQIWIELGKCDSCGSHVLIQIGVD